MAIRQPPSDIKDANLRGFLQELRNAIGGVGEQVNKLTRSVATISTGGGSGGGSDPGGGATPGGTPPPPPPSTATSVVLTIDPAKPKSSQLFSLTATVIGDAPTGSIQFLQNGALMTLDPATLFSATATLGELDREKGTYSFVAQYSGDTKNLPATSNTLTIEIGSVWDGPPDSVTSLTAESGVGFITLRWTMPYIGDLDVVEVWASETNDRSTATQIGESNGSLFVYVPDPDHLTWYFWVRVRDSEGLFSSYFPNTTAGVLGVAISLEDEIAASPLWSDLSGYVDEQTSYLQAQINTLSAIPEYDNAVTYAVDTLVSYSAGLYKAKSTTTGNLPTNTTYWDYIGQYQSVGDIAAATALIVDDMKAQYFVKTDVRGLVSGFGLYNDGVVSDFFVRADRFAVGSPSSSSGTCSISTYTNKRDCEANGGTWTYSTIPADNIPFIVYTTAQTISSPDGSGKTLTIGPGVYIKQANIQKAFIGDAEIYGHLKSYSWPTTGGTPNSAPGSFPFNGWILDKAGTLKLYGGGFGLWDEYGNPIITAGKISVNQFRRLILTGSEETFTVGPAPGYTNTPATITLRGHAQNLAGQISLAVVSGYSGTFSPITVASNGDADFSINPSSFTSSVAVFKASMTVDSVVYEDTITLAKVQEGSSALVMLMSNESDSLTANADGSVTGTVTLTSGIKVLRGAKNVLYGTYAESSPAWAISYSTAPTGTTFSYNATTGIFSIGVTSASPDRVEATITATRGTETLSKVMTATKQRQGVSGTNAKALSLNITAQTYTVKKDGSVSPSTWTATAVGQNLTGTPTWYWKWVTAPDVENGDGTTGWTLWDTGVTSTTYSPVDEPSWELRVNWNGLSDRVVLARLEEGSDALQAVLSNEAHVFPATTVGTVSSYTGSGTAIRVYSGATLLDYDGVGTASGKWTVSSSTSNITRGSLSSSGTSPNRILVVGQHSGVADGTDASSITYTITGKSVNGTAFTITKTQSFSKSKTGSTGPTGPTGPTGAQGPIGPSGIRGSATANITTYSAVNAWNAIVSASGTTPVPGDFVMTPDGSRYAYTSGTYPGNWSYSQTQLYGTVIVPGTLAANRITSGEIGSAIIKLGTSANPNDPNSVIQSYGFVSGSAGWRINGAGGAEFNTVIVRKPGNLLNDTVTTVGYGEWAPNALNPNTSNTAASWVSGTVYVYPAAAPQRVILLVTVKAQASNNNSTNVGVRIRRSDGATVAEHVFSLAGGFTSSFTISAVNDGYSGTLGYYLDTFNNWNSGGWINNFISMTVIVSMR